MLSSNEIKLAMDEKRNRIAQMKDKRMNILMAKKLFSMIDDLNIRFKAGINVNNIDRIAGFSDDFLKVIEPLNNLLNEMKSLRKDNQTIRGEFKNLKPESIKAELEKIISALARENFKVDNLGDIKIPDTVKISNLAEIIPLLEDIRNKIETSMKVEVQPANVTVLPTPVVIPKAEKVDFSDLLNPLAVIGNRLLKFSQNSEKNPIAVRLSDGKKWVDEILVKLNALQSTLMSSGGGGGGEIIVPSTQYSSKITAGAITTDFENLLSPTKAIRMIEILNFTNGDISLSFDEGETEHFILAPGKEYVRNYGSNFLNSGGKFYVKQGSKVPTLGVVFANALSN